MGNAVDRALRNKSREPTPLIVTIALPRDAWYQRKRLQVWRAEPPPFPVLAAVGQPSDAGSDTRLMLRCHHGIYTASSRGDGICVVRTKDARERKRRNRPRESTSAICKRGVTALY